MQDKSLNCRDCSQEFTFTASEQEFFAQKGFTNEPSRCPECRAARKARNGGSSGYSSSGSSFGRPERQMYPAVCAQCGKDTQVPFQPRDDRPVYCSDCYATKRPSGGYASSSSRGGYGRSSSGSRW